MYNTPEHKKINDMKKSIASLLDEGEVLTIRVEKYDGGSNVIVSSSFIYEEGCEKHAKDIKNITSAVRGMFGKDEVVNIEERFYATEEEKDNEGEHEEEDDEVKKIKETLTKCIDLAGQGRHSSGMWMEDAMEEDLEEDYEGQYEDFCEGWDMVQDYYVNINGISFNIIGCFELGHSVNIEVFSNYEQRDLVDFFANCNGNYYNSVNDVQRDIEKYF